MEAGRELDALVAEQVMLHVWKAGEIVGDSPEIGKLGMGWGAEGYPWVNPKTQPYSTDIAAAWEVLSALGKWGYDRVQLHRLTIEDREAWNVRVGYGLSGWEANADTAPTAICLAALRARGVDIAGVDIDTD